MFQSPTAVRLEISTALEFRAAALRIHARALAGVARLDSLALLFARLSVGILFASTGWGKVHNLSKVTGFFASLHIPAPGFNAALVGYSELLCGAALVIGLASRFATVPLCVSMIVALATAKAGEVHGLVDLVGQAELTYLVVLFAIAILGPGRVSLDELLLRFLGADTDAPHQNATFR